MAQPGKKAANPARGQLNRENNIPLSPCVRENLVSRDGFSRPVPRQPAHLHTQTESGAYLRDESMETTLRRRILFLWAGKLLRMSGGRLPKRIVLGNLEGAVRRGRGGKEKEWTDCVQSDIRAFGIAGDWKATALKAEVWVETVTEGGRGLWPRGGKKRKTRLDTARRREKQRAWETCYRRRECRILRSHTH